MRELHDHKLTGLNEAINIAVNDHPGPGGANHDYVIIVPKQVSESGAKELSGLRIQFQNGPIKETGINGISNEALLAIVIDRLRGFQYQRTEKDEFKNVPGPFACRENAIALTHLEDAMHWLQHRTRARLARGVEGTNQK